MNSEAAESFCAFEAMLLLLNSGLDLKLRVGSFTPVSSYTFLRATADGE